MRRVHLLLILSVTLLSGCLCPGPNGSCRSGGQSFFVPPVNRFNATETKSPSPCTAGKCQPPFYLTLAKYWPGLDQWATNQAANSCANRILFKQQWETLKFMPNSYKNGFRQAFVDVANGGNGTVPPVPPAEYWNAPYRSEAGQAVAARWFDGYREGAAMALVELDAMRQVASSQDWQVPPRDNFACATSCSTGSCPTGNCQTSYRPDAGLMGQPGNLVSARPMSGCPTCPQQAPPYPGQAAMPPTDPYAMAPMSPGFAPGFAPQYSLPPGIPSDSGLAPQPEIAPLPAQPPMTAPAPMTSPAPMPGPPAPGHAPNPGSRARSTTPAPPVSSAPAAGAPQPGYSTPSGALPTPGAAPRSATGQPLPRPALPAPGYSTGNGGASPSSIPAEGIVY